jgi:hypothetical protein
MRIHNTAICSPRIGSESNILDNGNLSKVGTGSVKISYGSATLVMYEFISLFEGRGEQRAGGGVPDAAA